jgi:O-antigen/teichoic acid export membrane protein
MAASFELGAEMSTAVMLRRAFTAGTGRVVWDGLARSLSFLLTVLLARSFGAEGYGSFAVAWYGAWMLSQATDLGLHLVTLRSLSRKLHDRVLASAVAAKASVTLLVVSGAAVVHWAYPLYPGSARLLSYLLCAQLVSSWTELAGIALRSRGRIALEGVLLTLLRTGWLAAGIWTIAAGTGHDPTGSLERLASALFFSGLPVLALAWVLVTRSGRFALGSASPVEALALVKQALPLAVTTAITLVYLRADLLIVAALRSAEEAGLFQSAFRLLEATFVLSGGIAAGTFPFVAGRMGREGFEGLARFVLALELACGVPLACAFVFFSDRIVTLVYGPSFGGAAPVLAVLGVALVAIFANALTTHLLVASGRTGRLVASMSVRLGVGVALDVLLVASWGALGGALAVAVAEWSLLAVSSLWVADLLGRPRSSPAPESVTPEGASSCS